MGKESKARIKSMAFCLHPGAKEASQAHACGEAWGLREPPLIVRVITSGRPLRSARGLWTSTPGKATHAHSWHKSLHALREGLTKRQCVSTELDRTHSRYSQVWWHARRACWFIQVAESTQTGNPPAVLQFLVTPGARRDIVPCYPHYLIRSAPAQLLPAASDALHTSAQSAEWHSR